MYSFAYLKEEDNSKLDTSKEVGMSNDTEGKMYKDFIERARERSIFYIMQRCNTLTLPIILLFA